MRSSFVVSSVIMVSAALGAGCRHASRRYEAVCQLISRETVETDPQGGATLVDVTLEWDACPGDQFQVVRGGAEFARCMAQYRVGEALPVRVSQWWDDRGFYTWDLYRVGACSHPIEPGTEGSFERSQECRPSQSYGRANGFRCSRRPFAGLVRVCPWMSR